MSVVGTIVPRSFEDFEEAAAPGHGEHFGHEADSDRLDFKRYWRILIKNWILVATIIGVALVLGVVATLVMTPRYRAITAIQIEREATKVLEGQDVQPVEQAAETERFLQTQVELLESRSLADAVANRLGLLRSGNPFLDQMKVKPVFKGLPADRARVVQREQVLGVLASNLDISWSRNSRIVRVSFQSPDPNLAATVANSFADSFISANLERRFESSAYAREFLEHRLGQTKAKLEASERAMIAYARGQQLIDASEGDTGASRGPRSLTTANLVQLDSAYSSARANRILAEERWRQARGDQIFNLPDVLGNGTIQNLLQKRAGLRADYEDRKRVFKEDYPTMRQLAAQIAEIDSQVNREATNIRNSIRTQYEVALQQESALSKDVGRLKMATLNEQGRSIRYNILRREADTNRTLYDALLQRYKEISLAGGITANNLSLVDRAEAPQKPYRPRPVLNLAVAGLLGGVLSLLFVFIRDRFDDTVRAPDDLMSKLGIHLVGLAPKLNRGIEPREELSDPRSELAEAYASIRASLQFSTSKGAPPALLVTSSQQSEGKSTTSAAIAISFARIGKNVLLIDSDLRKPSLHSFFGVPRETGLSSLLADQATFDQVLQPTSIPHLTFMACGPLPFNPSELLASGGIAKVLAEATARFDLVVFDGPPVMGLADAPLIASDVGAVIFVIESGRTHRGQSKVALNRMLRTRATIIGGILTKFDSRDKTYGSDYAYTYRYNYGSKGEA